jgi:hypothetical protein
VCLCVFVCVDFSFSSPLLLQLPHTFTHSITACITHIPLIFPTYSPRPSSVRLSLIMPAFQSACFICLCVCVCVCDRGRRRMIYHWISKSSCDKYNKTCALSLLIINTHIHTHTYTQHNKTISHTRSGSRSTFAAASTKSTSIRDTHTQASSIKEGPSSPPPPPPHQHSPPTTYTHTSIKHKQYGPPPPLHLCAEMGALH